MKAIQMTSKSSLWTLVVPGLMAIAQPAAAELYELHAASTTITMDDGTEVPMWGFGLGTEGAVSIPGPVLDVPPGDDTLTISLTNQLPVAVSIVIPAIPAALMPVWDDGTSGPRTNLEQRAVSFTYVAQPGATVTYEWINVQPGTYVYQSGTHPAVQVPMGLYGAVRHDAAAGQSYGVAYDNDVVLVYSEVDPTLNGAVADGTYGMASFPTTIGYRARYFLINGQETSPPVLAQSVNQSLLLRLVNAGLQSIVPTLASGVMSLLAEDGQPAPYARQSYSMLLPPGKTRDALLVLSEATGTVLFDRRGGSQLARINTASPDDAPIAVMDVYDATEDATLDTVVAGLPSVLDNDTGVGLSAVLSSATSAGALELLADGTFIYTSAPNWSGVDTFSYYATDGTFSSNVATVSINVGAANDEPVAVDDHYDAFEGATLLVVAPGVLHNDGDPDGDALSAQLVMGPSAGTLSLLVDGAFEYTPDPGTTTDSFTYEVADGSTTSDVATVAITVVEAAGAAPLAVNDYAATLRNTAVIIDVIANDSDGDGDIDPSSVTVTSLPTRGATATSLGDGTVRYEPRANFKGTETFTYAVSDYAGMVSEPATVRINVTTP